MLLKDPPLNELELLNSAQELKGKTFSELANELNHVLPTSFLKAKGFMGQLIEQYLGANAGNKSIPDFYNIGIELKTLPYNAKSDPQETTYVCTATLSADAAVETWENSRVRKKLNQVLFVPIEGDRQIPISSRKIGRPFLFKLKNHPELEAILQSDWEELMEMLHLGEISRLSAKFGQFLQIRPKAANSKVLTTTFDGSGEDLWTCPKGFYLRKEFTKKLLNGFKQNTIA